MKTVIKCSDIMELRINDGSKFSDRKVLCSASKFDVNAWMIHDYRLMLHKGPPNPYSCSLVAETVCTYYKPETEFEDRKVRALIRDHFDRKDIDGIDYICWSTFNGLVPGTPREGSWVSRHNHVGFHTYSEAKAYLKEAQDWWSQFEGDPKTASIPNLYRQPGMTDIRFLLNYPDLLDDVYGKAFTFRDDFDIVKWKLMV